VNDVADQRECRVDTEQEALAVRALDAFDPRADLLWQADAKQPTAGQRPVKAGGRPFASRFEAEFESKRSEVLDQQARRTPIANVHRAGVAPLAEPPFPVFPQMAVGVECDAD